MLRDILKLAPAPAAKPAEPLEPLRPLPPKAAVASLGYTGLESTVNTNEIKQHTLLEIPTPEEQALGEGNILNQRCGLSGGDINELNNGYTGLFYPHPRNYRAERAAFVVDKALQLGLVPTTIIREFPGEYADTERGSFQKYIPDAHELTQDNLGNYDRSDLFKVGLLYYAIWENDGRIENVLEAGGKLHAIDHHQAFYEEAPSVWQPRRTSFIDFSAFTEFYDEAAPPEVVRKANEFLRDESLQEALGVQLMELIPEPDAEACLARIKHIATVLATEGRIGSPEELKDYFPA